MADINATVFKSYDIRGTYPDQLDERFAHLLGRALPAVLGGRRAVIGHDCRLSSPALYAALSAGLAQAGVEVSGLGLCPSELVYFATASRAEFDLGVMVTASHNPPEYNGFKVVGSAAQPISAASGLGDVRAAMEGLTAEATAGAEAPDPVTGLAAAYTDFALDLVGAPDGSGLRIVVDAGNGVGGLFWDWLSPLIGVEPVRLNCEPDGRFPAHHPDPSRRENLEPLIAAVLAEGADLGFSYDGDADRVVAVLGDGHVVDGSEMIVCLADRLIGGDSPPAFGVGHTTSRKALDHFAGLGTAPVLMPVGHAKIKAILRETPAMVFAGEDAGHYYYRDFFCCDSSLITTLHLLHLASGGRLTDLIGGLPGPWVRPLREPSFRFDEQSRALEVCRDVALAAVDHHPDPVEITCEKDARVQRHCAVTDVQDCDGVRVDYADWWFCVRPSGTEPIARLALEARTDDLLAQRTQALSSLFETLM